MYVCQPAKAPFRTMRASNGVSVLDQELHSLFTDSYLLSALPTTRPRRIVWCVWRLIKVQIRGSCSRGYSLNTLLGGEGGWHFPSNEKQGLA